MTPASRTLLARWLTILGCLLAMAAVIVRMAHRAETPGAQAARAIASGEARHAALTDDDAGDQDLSDDEAAAGEAWADHHKGAGPDACPDYSSAFRKGCLDRMNGEDVQGD
jgi:hypothetical protein